MLCHDARVMCSLKSLEARKLRIKLRYKNGVASRLAAVAGMSLLILLMSVPAQVRAQTAASDAQPHIPTALINVAARKTVDLSGAWHSIVDPYDTGFYDYRWQENADGYFRNRKPASPADRVEYDFDASPTLQVPGDWNTQRESLFLYEGSVW